MPSSLILAPPQTLLNERNKTPENVFSVTLKVS